MGVALPADVPGKLFPLICAMAAVTALAANEPVAPKELQTRVDQYLSLRKKVAQGIPSLKGKASPEEIASHKKALAQAVLQARQDARQGEILGPPVEGYLREILRSETKGEEGSSAKRTTKDGNPTVEQGFPGVAVKVNGVYTDGAPVSSVPATILLRLPKLPSEVEFRFVGRTLILRDVDAGLILDFLPNALP